MDLRALVEATLRGDLLAARQWVADAQRARLDWEKLQFPSDLAGRDLTVAAGLVELLATRAGAQSPRWTSEIGAERELLVLDPGLEQMPRSLAHAKDFGPEPLRKRNLVALPDFLAVA